MRLSTRSSAELIAWAAERIDCMREHGAPEAATAMGVEASNGRILGVVMFHSWEPWYATLEVSAAADDARWLLARGAINEMWNYAFNVCGAQKIWSRTPKRNIRALRFLKALGFTYEAVLPRQFGSDDAVISRKFREEHFGGQVARANAA